MVISYGILKNRRRLFEIFSQFHAKSHKKIDKLAKMLAFTGLLLDIYNSWNDFNFFAIMALHFPGLFAIDFLHCIVEMLEICSNELEIHNKQFEFQGNIYHRIHNGVNIISGSFGATLLDHILLSSCMALCFCYTHSRNGMVFTRIASFAPDIWTVIFMMTTFSIARATHKLKIKSEECKQLNYCCEIQLWQLNYEKMIVSAWDFYTIDNHIFIWVSNTNFFFSLFI